MSYYKRFNRKNIVPNLARFDLRRVFKNLEEELIGLNPNHSSTSTHTIEYVVLIE